MIPTGSCPSACFDLVQTARVERLERRAYLSAAVGAAIAAISPAGSEFHVNTYTTNRQAFPAVAMDPAGDFVVAWQSYGPTATDANYGIYAQRYNAAGVAQGAQINVPTTRTSNETRPAVAMDGVGDFVVAWQGSDVSQNGIFAQRYDASGTKQGAELRVNSTTANVQAYPTVAMDAAGDFVVAWQSSAQDTSNTYGIYAQRYNASGAAQGGEFRANTVVANSQTYPAAAMDVAGDFIITWQSAGQDPDGSGGIYAQRYDAGGAAQGVEFRVNTFIQSNQSFPAVAMDKAGDFVVSWASYNQEGGFAGVYAQRYAAGGAAAGAELHVNTTTDGQQRMSAVAMDADGDFVITWHSYYQDPNNGLIGIYAQRFAKTGATDGGEFRVNTFTPNNQRYPAVGMDATGDFAVAWTSYGQETGDNTFQGGIYAQRYTNPVAAVISQVYVRGSTWAGPDGNPANTTFKEYLAAKGIGDDTYGFRVDNVAANTTLPWINANQVVLRYAEPVSGAGIPGAGTITLEGQVSDYTVTSVTQLDSQTFVLNLDRALGLQPAGAPDPTVGDRVKLTVRGAAAGGADFSLALNPLQGDSDRAATTRVTALDLGFVKARSNRTATEVPPAGAAYTAFADLNADGRINATDLGAVKARINDSLPAAAPAAARFGDDRIAAQLLR
jgi:hypothetical protein